MAKKPNKNQDNFNISKEEYEIVLNTLRFALNYEEVDNQPKIIEIFEKFERFAKIYAQYYDSNEIHTHNCIDELFSTMKDYLDRIEEVWSKNNLSCNMLKSELSAIFGKDLNELNEELELFTEELEEIEIFYYQIKKVYGDQDET